MLGVLKSATCGIVSHLHGGGLAVQARAFRSDGCRYGCRLFRQSPAECRAYAREPVKCRHLAVIAYPLRLNGVQGVAGSRPHTSRNAREDNRITGASWSAVVVLTPVDNPRRKALQLSGYLARP
jgi:hypothetical protein